MSGTLDDYLTRLGLPSGGAVRVSLGIASSPQDLAVFLGFVEDTPYDRPASAAASASPPPPLLTAARSQRRVTWGSVTVRRFAGSHSTVRRRICVRGA
jgi:hypothetical protein